MSVVAARTPMELVRLSAAHLNTHGSDSPRLDAEILAAHALGCRRLDLYLQFERPLDPAEVDVIRELVRWRATGEPVAYITGEKEFYGRPFRVTKDTLIPRPETEHLIEHVVAWARDRGAIRILDLGTGSGCVGITLACELPEASVLLTDVSAAAIDVAAGNATQLGVGERVTHAVGSWWQAVPAGEHFDVVVSNPPYITSAEMADLPRDVGEFEPGSALSGGDDGLEAYREIVSHLENRNTKLAAFEIDPRRASAVVEMVQSAMPKREVSVHKDLAGLDRVVLAS